MGGGGGGGGEAKAVKEENLSPVGTCEFQLLVKLLPLKAHEMTYVLRGYA